MRRPVGTSKVVFVRIRKGVQKRCSAIAGDDVPVLKGTLGYQAVGLAEDVLDDVETIATYAQDMSEFLKNSELTQRRAFIETFVKEIVVMPGKAVVRYTVPMPDDSPIPGQNAEDMALNGSVLSIVKFGGPDLTVDRTIFEMWLVLAGSPRSCCSSRC